MFLGQRWNKSTKCVGNKENDRNLDLFRKRTVLGKRYKKSFSAFFVVTKISFQFHFIHPPKRESMKQILSERMNLFM